MPVYNAEEWPLFQLGRLAPVLDRLYRTGPIHSRSEWYSNGPPLHIWSTWYSTDNNSQSLRSVHDVGVIDPDQLRPPEAAAKTQEKDCAVANA
jgi:hypothetical protein